MAEVDPAVDTIDGDAAEEANDSPPGRRRRLSGEAAIVLFAIPVIVLIGVLSFIVWHETADVVKEDSIVASALAYDEIVRQTIDMIQLTFTSAAIVVAIAVPLGIGLTRGPLRRAAPLVIGIANAGQAAPSVGLIVLIALWWRFGFWSGVTALALYAILPVLRNTIVGLEGVDRTIIEAGRGMGMSSFSVLMRIELPLALPVIMSGVRTALVLLVGTATLATFIAAGGLGATIQAGIALLRYPVIVWGSVLVALLALLIEWVGRVLELLLRPKGI